MKQEILYILGSVIIVSLISLIGVVSLVFSKKNLQKVIFFLVSFSAGALLGDAFIHLLPEAIKTNGFGIETSLYILGGILVFFILEKFIHWHHCHIHNDCDLHEHESQRHPHSLAIMNIIGGGVHNFTDGMIIGISYLISIPLGIATTIAIMLHEIPREFGDFGILLHAGLSTSKAIFLNFMSAIVAILGAILAIFISGYATAHIQTIMLLIAAGGFIYIAGTDLIPELHKLNSLKMSILQLIGIIAGVAVMMILLIIG